MRGSRFPALAALLTGAAAAAAPASVAASEDDPDNTIELGAVENAMAVEVDKATAAATTAANTRWNAVMTSDEGKKNPAAAARALNGSTMSSDDVIAMLGDLSPAVAAAPEKPGKPEGSAGASRERLAGGGREASPDTGGSGGAQQSAEKDGGGLSAAEHRKRTADARNAATTSAAGGAGNVRSAGATGR